VYVWLQNGSCPSCELFSEGAVGGGSNVGYLQGWVTHELLTDSPVEVLNGGLVEVLIPVHYLSGVSQTACQTGIRGVKPQKTEFISTLLPSRTGPIWGMPKASVDPYYLQTRSHKALLASALCAGTSS
jgi:hypothetical protein